MRLKTYPTKPDYKFGDTRVTLKYAWWLKRVEDTLIWLEPYELVEIKSDRPRTIFIGHIMLMAPWGWDFVEERLIKPGLPDYKNPPPPPPLNSKP